MGFLIRMVIFLLWTTMTCTLIGLATSPTLALGIFLLLAVSCRNSVIHGGIVEEKNKPPRNDDPED
jgi:hypothetical protein